MRWMVVVPLKRLATAKSRLRSAVDAPGPALALALACDTVAAALGHVEVLVVCDDPVATAALRQLGATVVAEPEYAGLNGALRHGSALARRADARPAALTGDLPALRAADLAAALDACGPRATFVADAAGAGTTLLAAAVGADLAPRFGPDSAAAHQAIGAVALTPAPSRLRLDVDTAADLAAAAALGLGPHTRAVLAGQLTAPLAS
ncbi:2-phospho-L-lactate guanylyltransferase [Pilimelia columellifera]